ncbi:XRE family transcriptional regulator [Catenulispora yoronensis]
MAGTRPRHHRVLPRPGRHRPRPETRRGRDPPPVRPGRPQPPQLGSAGPAEPRPVDDVLVRLVDAWLPNPGHIVDCYWNLVVANRAAQLALHMAEPGSNCLHQYFLDEIYRENLENWEELAPLIVASYRSEMTANPGNEGFQQIVESLAAQSPEFATLWNRQDVAHNGARSKVLSSKAGALHFESVTLGVPNRADLRVVLHNPQAATDTAARLNVLLAEDERRNGLRLVAG